MLRLDWDQGAGNSGKPPQRSELKLELAFTVTGGICQGRLRVNAEGPKGGGCDGIVEPGFKG